MPRALRPLLAVAALAGLAATASASVQSAWPLLAFDRANGCELAIAGNGRFLELRASGLVPGEALRLTLANGDMKPLDWQVYAGGGGTWSKLYIPFRFNRSGGTVRVGVDASRCTLAASVPWRREVPVVD